MVNDICGSKNSIMLEVIGHLSLNKHSASHIDYVMTLSFCHTILFLCVRSRFTKINTFSKQMIEKGVIIILFTTIALKTDDFTTKKVFNKGLKLNKNFQTIRFILHRI